ncbi:MAG TPA: DUF1858 domain-containing protein [Candidatus Hypogeohydataceae bacterium YC41]
MQIDKNSIIKDIIVKHPQTFEVFKRHRLILAGGVRGPNEPLAFFCKAHDVDLETLLKELEEAINKGPVPGMIPPPIVEDIIYYRYIKTALIICLTLGCTFGAGLLSYIALKFDYYIPPIILIQSHAHAQLYGWVGLFIMGFAYYILPRVKNTDLYAWKITYLSFWTVLVGTVLRTLLQTQPGTSLAILIPVSGALQLLGVLIFCYVLFGTVKSSQLPKEIFDKFFVAGLIWFFAATVQNLYIDLYLYQHSTMEIPSSFNKQLIHVFLFGFVCMFIFGVNLRTVYAFLDVPRPNPSLVNLAFWVINASIFLYFFEYLSSWLTYSLAGAIFLFIYGLRVFEKPTKELADVIMDRSYEKTIRAAYFWLIVGLLIRVIVPSLGGASTPTGHLFHGSSNHAVTVGFISMMMIGYSSKMVPTFRGVNLYSFRLSELTFFLLNLGIILRVFFQLLVTKYPAIAYPAVGASGWIEVTALSLFAYNLWKTMNLKEEPLEACPTKKLEKITKDTKVADVIEQYPETMEVFLQFGFHQIANPVARRTMAKMVTLEAACQFHGVDLEKFMAALNDKLENAKPCL